MESFERIDTHVHMVPAEYREYLAKRGADSIGGVLLPDWNPQMAVDFMDQHGIAASVVSVSAPGVYFGDATEARTMARVVNEAAAKLKNHFPGRFGFFASLTLPDVEGAIAEAVYSFDTLGADGVVLFANAAGTYLGDAAFDALFQELDRRSAVIFVHPSDLPGAPGPDIPTFAADFLLDTTRAALNMAKAGGVLIRFPNLKVLLAHAGGFVPYAAYRMAPICSPHWSIEEGLAVLKNFYFDVALSSSSSALPSLLAFANHDHVTFGTDFPFAPVKVSEQFAGQLDAYALTAEQRLSIDSGAAGALFPNLANDIKQNSKFIQK